MKYAIVYSSKTGNTKMLADKIASLMPQEECIYQGEPTSEALNAELIFIGFWTNQGQCDSETKEFFDTLTNQKVFVFGTAGFGSQQAYLDNVLKKSESLLPKSVEIIGDFICQGKMPLPVRQRYEKMLENPQQRAKAQMLIDNFDMASSHPNCDDLNNLENKIKGIL